MSYTGLVAVNTPGLSTYTTSPIKQLKLTTSPVIKLKLNEPDVNPSAFLKDAAMG
jgi:hypothetical protein